MTGTADAGRAAPGLREHGEGLVVSQSDEGTKEYLCNEDTSGIPSGLTVLSEGQKPMDDDWRSDSSTRRITALLPRAAEHQDGDLLTA